MENVCQALGELGDPYAVPVLIKVLHYPDNDLEVKKQQRPP